MSDGRRDLSLAVVTGGHGFDKPAFAELMEDLGRAGIAASVMDLRDFTAQPSEIIDVYDAVLFYFFPLVGPFGDDPRSQAVLEGLLSAGKGVIILHHALLAYPKWDTWDEVVGAGDRDRFTCHQQRRLSVEIVDPTHEITRGEHDWGLIDETYLMNEPEGTPLMRVEHPESTKIICWTRTCRKSRVFCLQPGHDSTAWRLPEFRRILARGIAWTAMSPVLVNSLATSLGQGETRVLTHNQVQSFDRDGFVVVEGFFSQEEAAILRTQAHDSERPGRHDLIMPDVAGRSTKLALWTNIQDDIFGEVASHPRIVASMRMLLREDCYHWHSKITFKEPHAGGAWEWHQDYGYWYHDGCPYPRLASCMIALDPTDRSNGCLKVVSGSHHLGRIEHGSKGAQLGANLERVVAIESLLPVRYLEVGAGAAVFFHCNTLHASESNRSDRFRTSFICCYNGMSNIPLLGGGHGRPVPITLSTEDSILRFDHKSASMTS